VKHLLLAGLFDGLCAALACPLNLQGYATGDLDKDAFSVRYFAHERGMELMVTQSYSKNFGLYGERIGALNVVCSDPACAKRIQSQLGLIVRAMVSNPPLHGAQLVATVIGNDGLYKQWDSELKMMSQRIVSMRGALVQALQAIDCPTPAAVYKDWGHITSQIGMFAFTGLQAKHVKILADKYHIYCTSNGRFSMAGVNPGNVEYIAGAMKDALETAGPADVAAGSSSSSKPASTPTAPATAPAAAGTALSVEYKGPCDPLGRPLVLDGTSRGAPKAGATYAISMADPPAAAVQPPETAPPSTEKAAAASAQLSAQTVCIGINGFGRIGRLVTRAALSNQNRGVTVSRPRGPRCALGAPCAPLSWR
jgi:hypothetical protein